MMKSRLFSSESRLSDLITAHPSLLTLLTRLGISLGFGDRSIADVCEESGVDTAFFLLICNVYTFNNYVPSTATILGTDMAGLVPYLEKSHRYYVDKRLPHIERHLDAIAQKLNGRIGQVFISFFKEYKREVVEHFAHEERDVFPHIEALMGGRKTRPTASASLCTRTATSRANWTICSISSSSTCRLRSMTTM